MANLDKAAHGEIGAFDTKSDVSFSYASINQSDKSVENTPDNKNKQEAFQFADVIDVINPLQHLPIVGMIYREVTGDELHPMAQIIGGALYGGPVGAVIGTVNAIAQVQTGHDMSDHALGVIGFKSFDGDVANIDKNNPIEQLNNAANAQFNGQSGQPLPHSALSFTNIPNNTQYESVDVAEGRTAGKQPSIGNRNRFKQNFASDYNSQIVAQDFSNKEYNGTLKENNHSRLAAYEPIKTIDLSPMPPREIFN
jgi:hypothetical protein